MDSIKEIEAIWLRQPESFPVFLEENPELFPKVGWEQKKENETLVEEFSRRIRKKAKGRPGKKELQEQWDRELERELEPEFEEFLVRERILFLTRWMGRELLEDMKGAVKGFAARIREFDDTLGGRQIWQAMRNYLIYAMIVEMQGGKQKVEDPILAYSLLYPYTDNYLDDAEISGEEKNRYNRMIAQKLKGETTVPGNGLEEKTCHLLDMILGAYGGGAKKKVAGVLLRLLEAQSSSVGQGKAGVTEEEILKISIWKGSTSVLADYLFSTEDWRENEESFYLKFGFLLQLVDDLQDVEEDREAGSHTLMRAAAEEGRLEGRVNRLLWFIWRVVGDFTPRNPGLKDFVLKNCVGITLLSAAVNREYLFGEYMRQLEPYLPFSLEFIERGKNLPVWNGIGGMG